MALLSFDSKPLHLSHEEQLRQKRALSKFAGFIAKQYLKSIDV